MVDPKLDQNKVLNIDSTLRNKVTFCMSQDSSDDPTATVQVE